MIADKKEFLLLRRKLLALGAGLACGGASGCSIFRRTPTVFCDSDASLSSTETDLAIDVHAHIFNASDLQVKRFLELVASRQDTKFGGLVRTMGGLLQGIGWSVAPSAEEELEMLRKLRPKIEQCDSKAHVELVDDLREPGYRTARRELQSALAKQGRMTNTSSAGAEARIQNERAALTVDERIERIISNLPETAFEYRADARTRAREGNARASSAQGFIGFIVQMFQFRYVSLYDYLQTYSTGRTRKIDLVVVHLVDYDWWLAKGAPTKTRLEDQVKVMREIFFLTKGRVQAFIPFDPLREVAFSLGLTSESSLAIAQAAVRESGFTGVKLYPPMGFAAYGNGTLDVWKGKDWLPELVRRSGFGKLLDDVMANLYRWCIEEQVPLMAHTNHSNGAADDFEALAGAPHWEKALGQFGVSGDKRLRVNFGHFGHGGTPGMVAPTMSERFVSLMTDQRGGGAFTFADASYFSEILDDRDRLKNILISLYLSKANNNPGLLAARLMYGSDWEMCIPESNVGDYFTEFQILYGEIGQQLRQSQGDSWAGLESKFFGINAVHYLGLRRGELTRKRIERFFAGKPQPSWMTKVDRLPAI